MRGKWQQTNIKVKDPLPMTSRVLDYPLRSLLVKTWTFFLFSLVLFVCLFLFVFFFSYFLDHSTLHIYALFFLAFTSSIFLPSYISLSCSTAGSRAKEVTGASSIKKRADNLKEITRAGS